jgi:small subunit ribosomal protein S16
MLKIRLQRTGRTNEPSFRLVLTDSKNSTKSGRALEVLGSHDFRKTTTAIDADRVKYWMKQGAQPTDTVHNLLISEKVIEGKKKNVLPKKTVAKKEEPAPAPAEKAPVAEPAATPAPEATEEIPVAEAPTEPESPKSEESPKDPA